MNRIVFIVEGDTEILLVDKVIMPHIYDLGYQIAYNCQTITTNRKQHKKGGVGSYGKFKNEIQNTLSQGDVLVTTLIDFFKLPTDFPQFTDDSSRIQQIETAIHQDFDSNPNLLPYIQRHEVEALMYSSMEGFELVMDEDEQLKKVQQIIDQYPNPEDINNSPATAPSKRLQKIYDYDKTGDGEMIFEMVGIEAMLEKCPRFANWINSIKNRLDEYA
ncbi:DUF4276 family protein [Marinifilum fragile]|uniref:DUF4276 family protein n=1 Tax=Marinifilum fragile TaxID=570161 RepID=UPI002AA71087|nr:DUF4276 family protein [Marinifilum fragile]